MTIEPIGEGNAGRGRVDHGRRQGPSLSIVVPSRGTPETLAHAVEALCGRCGDVEAEIVIVRAADAPPLDRLWDPRAVVTVIGAAGETSDAELRLLGMAATRGDIVAFREDSAVGDAGWLGPVVRALALPRPRADDSSVTPPVNAPPVTHLSPALDPPPTVTSGA